MSDITPRRAAGRVRILQAVRDLHDREITSADLARELNLAVSTTQADMSFFVEEGLVDKIYIHGKKSYTFRLTSAGKARLEQSIPQLILDLPPVGKVENAPKLIKLITFDGRIFEGLRLERESNKGVWLDNLYFSLDAVREIS